VVKEEEEVVDASIDCIGSVIDIRMDVIYT
jgi:hypothetical protein